MQTTFLKELMIMMILRGRWLYAKDINLKKVNDFSLSQKTGLVCR